MIEKLPPELHSVVIAYLKLTPLSLTTLEEVCRSWFAVFSAHSVWNLFDPYMGSDSRQQFLERVNAMTIEQKANLRLCWQGKLCHKGDPADLDTRLAFHFNVKKKAVVTDRRIALTALKTSGKAYMVFSEELKHDKEIIDKTMAIDARMAHEFPVEFLSDKAYVEPAVRILGSLMKFASPELQDDKQLALLAVDNFNPKNFRFQGYPPLRYLSDRLRDDDEVVLKAVRRSGETLAYASERLKRHEPIITAAIEQCALAFLYIPDRTCKQYLYALAHAKNEDEVKLMIGEWPEVRKYPDLNEQSLLKFPKLISMVSKGLQSSRPTALKVVVQYGAGLQYLARELQNDEEVVRTACANDPAALRWASGSFFSDRDLVLAAVKADGLILKKAVLFQDDPEIVDAAIEQNPSAIKYTKCPTAAQDQAPVQEVTEWDVGKMMIAKGMEDLYTALNY